MTGDQGLRGFPGKPGADGLPGLAVSKIIISERSFAGGFF